MRVNVRVRRRVPLKKPDSTAAYDVLKETAETGSVPAGWEVAAVDWQGFVRHGKAFVPGRGRHLQELDPDAKFPSQGTGWRSGRAEDLAALLGPILEGDVQVGWEKRTRRVRRKRETVVWVRWRSVGTATKARGTWVSEAYARRYPHLVYVGKQEVRAEWVHETVTDYEAEVRVDYE